MLDWTNRWLEKGNRDRWKNGLYIKLYRRNAFVYVCARHWSYNKVFQEWRIRCYSNSTCEWLLTSHAPLRCSHDPRSLDKLTCNRTDKVIYWRSKSTRKKERHDRRGDITPTENRTTSSLTDVGDGRGSPDPRNSRDFAPIFRRIVTQRKRVYQNRRPASDS